MVLAGGVTTCSIFLTCKINLYTCHTQGGLTPLYVASGKGHSDVVKTLIQNGADINLVSKVWRLLSQDH